MKGLKIRISLILALALAFFAAIGTLFASGTFASADRDTVVDGTSTTLFNAADGAALRAHEQAAEGDENDYYTMFALTKNASAITYKKNLAYTWYANVAKTTETEGEGDGAVEKEVEDVKNPACAQDAGKNVASYFNMEIGFEGLNFKKYIIAFESQQYWQTKDEKTTNYVIFVPAEDGEHVNVIITDNKDEKNLTADVNLQSDHIKIEFTARDKDEYSVTVSDAASATVSGKFVNVGGSYAKYTSTSTLTVVPLTFSAELSEPAEGETAKPACMALYELNGQSFKLKSAKKEEGNDYFTGSTVVDNTPPVLCIDDNFTFVRRGEEIKFDYAVIDVLQPSPSSTVSYFLLTNGQQDGTVQNFNPADCSDTKLFTEIKSGKAQRVIPRVEHYVPVSGDYNAEIFGDNARVTAAVKVNVKLTDYSYTGGQSTYVLLDWYVNDDLLLTIGGNKYLAVATDEVGATFNYNETKTGDDGEITVSNPKSEKWLAMVAAYQKEVNKAAKGLKAGSKNYFYLPALDKIEYELGGVTYVGSLLSDNVTEYTDLSFSIYYNNGSQQSPLTARKNSNLAITIGQEGDYGFTVYALDSSSKQMHYFDSNGKQVEFASSEIWSMRADTDKDDSGVSVSEYIPWFTFHVGAAELSIEAPKEQDTAYVENTTSVSFEVNGVSGKYQKTTTLYLFNNELYYEYANEALTYDKFMEIKQQLFENTAFKDENGDPVNSRRWFDTIQITSGSDSVDESSSEYEAFADYEWNGSSSFIPQDANALYLVVCKVVGNDGQTDTAYMGIAAAPKVRDIVGEDTWLQDNMTSVILLCIAGASLIGIVLLLVIKPKDKGDVDENFTEVKRSKKSK